MSEGQGGGGGRVRVKGTVKNAIKSAACTYFTPPIKLAPGPQPGQMQRPRMMKPGLVPERWRCRRLMRPMQRR